MDLLQSPARNIAQEQDSIKFQSIQPRTLLRPAGITRLRFSTKLSPGGGSMIWSLEQQRQKEWSLLPSRAGTAEGRLESSEKSLESG